MVGHRAPDALRMQLLGGGSDNINLLIIFIVIL